MVVSLLSVSIIKLRFWTTRKSCSDMLPNMLGLGFRRKCDFQVCIRSLLNEASLEGIAMSGWMMDALCVFVMARMVYHV